MVRDLGREYPPDRCRYYLGTAGCPLRGGPAAVTTLPGEVFHATTVSINGKGGVLILGPPSGSGKSALALELMALGAVLVADDRSRVTAQDGQLIAHAPPPPRLQGVIEARHVGLIRVPHVETVPPLRLAVDMGGQLEPDRLPQPKSLTISGTALDLLWRVDAPPHFPSAIWQLVNGGEAVR